MSDAEEEKESLLSEPDVIILVILVCLIVSIVVRQMVREFHVAFMQNAILLLLSVGAAIVFVQVKAFRSQVTIFEIPTHEVYNIFVPIFTMATLYRVESYVLLHSLPQVLTIVFTKLITCPLLGFLVMYTLDTDSRILAGICGILITVPIQPLHVVLVFKHVTKHRYVRTMLDLESVLMLLFVDIMLKLLFGVLGGFVYSWTHIACILVRLVLGGLVVGWTFGYLVVHILRWLYNDPANALMVTLGMNLFIFYVTDKLLAGSGVLAVTVLNYLVALNMHHLTTEVSRTLVSFFNVLHYTFDSTALMVCSCALIIRAINRFDLRELYGSVLIYIVNFVVRLLELLAISPLLAFMRYELNIRCLLVLGFAHIKGSLNLMLVLRLLEESPTRRVGQKCTMEVLIAVLLTNVINVSLVRLLLRVLGLMGITTQQQINLNTCVMYIMVKRLASISNLKMNRFFALANWHQTRIDTYVPMPYMNIGQTAYEHLAHPPMDDVSRHEHGNCPACYLDLPKDTTEESMSIMLREFELTILKRKKMSIIKQYETGQLNKYCLEILVHQIEILYHSKKEPDGLNPNQRQQRNRCLMYIRMLLVKLYTPHEPDMSPRSESYCAIVCFYLTLHIAYDTLLCMLTLAYAATACVVQDDGARNSMWLCHIVMTSVFLTDFVLKLFALSNVWLIISGIAPYFRWKRNIFDFVLLFFMLLNLHMCRSSNVYEWWYYYVLPPPRLLAVVRLLQLPNLLSFFSRFAIKWIDKRYDVSLRIDFALTTALLTAADDILESLPAMITLTMVRVFYYEQLQEERAILIQKVDMIRAVRPWIAVAVKAKQAINTTLTAMTDSLDEFKTAGFVDNIEHSFIYDGIVKRQKRYINLAFVPSNTPKMIVAQVLWMSESNREVVEYLCANAQFAQWLANEVVVRVGSRLPGVYVLLSGMLHLRYQPTKGRRQSGQVPVVDYLSTTDFTSNIDTDLSTGNSFGELSALTGRPYDCTIQATTAATAFLLPHSVLAEAMQCNHDPLIGLESRMWKCSIINLAVAVLMEFPLYQTYTPLQLVLKLERSFVSKLTSYEEFFVTQTMGDIILMDGIVRDHATSETFNAPMLIPRRVQKLTWHSSVSNVVEPRLLIIPMADNTEYKMMEQKERSNFEVQITKLD